MFQIIKNYKVHGGSVGKIKCDLGFDRLRK